MRFLNLILVVFLWAGTAASSRAQLLHDLVDAEVRMSPVASDVVGKRALHTRASEGPLLPFTGVAAEFGSDADDVSAEVRFEVAGSWTVWRSMHITASPMGGTLLAGYHQDGLIPAERYELRLSSPESAIAVIRESGTFNNLTDTDRNVPEGVVALRGSSTGIIIPPPLITRADWGAAPFKLGSPSPLANGAYRYMTFHHAAGWSATTLSEGIAAVKSIQDFHQNGRGWSDIGYQFVIDRAGRVYQGRPFLDNSTSLTQVPALAMGAHVGGANTGNIGISMLGCYHPPEGSYCEEELTPEALETYITMFAFLSERYGVAPTLIRGHRDFSPTSCPGDNNYRLLPDIRTDVAELLLTGNAPIGAASVTAEASDAGFIQVSWEILEVGDIETVIVERVVGNESTVIFTGAPESGSVSDASAPGGVPVSYRVYGLAGDGRRQQLASIASELGRPVNYVLSDAFPNPVSGATAFRYFVPTEGDVTIRVFDAAGREVGVLEDRFVDGNTWGSARFDASTLASGLYFYRMTVEGFSGTVFDKTQSFVVQKP